MLNFQEMKQREKILNAISDHLESKTKYPNLEELYSILIDSDKSLSFSSLRKSVSEMKAEGLIEEDADGIITTLSGVEYLLDLDRYVEEKIKSQKKNNGEEVEKNISAGGDYLPTKSVISTESPSEEVETFNGFSILAMILVVFGLFSEGLTSPFGFIFGVISLLQIRKTGEKGELLSWLSIIIGGLWSIMLLLIVIQIINY